MDNNHKHGDKLLQRLNGYLSNDISKLMKMKQEQINNNNKPEDLTHEQVKFIEYLVSVATHPIGLEASICPFNESPEHMLAYIWHLFSINDTQSKQLLNKIQIQKPNENDLNAVHMSARKRHSWRPELRVRLIPPAFFFNQQTYLNNLSVRIYIFKEQKIVHGGDDLNTNKKKNVLDKIFRSYQLDSSTKIRPITEAKSVVRFQSTTVAQGNKSSKLSYKMVQVVTAIKPIKQPNKSILVDGDVKLKLRRYYCNPETVHILRFEFWLDAKSAANENSCLQKCTNMVKNFSSCGGKSPAKLNSSVNQRFYGYINIKLSQLPSYATKLSYPILSLKENNKINNCEICLEPRNRRIIDDDENVQFNDAKPEDKPKKSRDKFLINHMRMYANCILYHCLYSKATHNFDAIQSVTIDNLFYIPAYTLINQHRLQSNLNQSDDKCLRRVGILSLIKLLEDGVNFKNLRQVKLMLISVMQNEYAIAKRTMDDKTMHELDPFLDESSSFDNMIAQMELSTIENFANTFLDYQLRKYFMNIDDSEEDRTKSLERLIALSGLRLFRSATSLYSSRSKRAVNLVNNLLSELICEFIFASISKNLNSNEKESQSKEKLWSKLMNYLRHINQDLKSYWTTCGLSELISANKPRFVRLFDELERQGLRSVIETKLINYID